MRGVQGLIDEVYRQTHVAPNVIELHLANRVDPRVPTWIQGEQLPKVVITMPAYRAAKTLAKTVADIPAGVADLLLLVDDASPDDTEAIARALGLRVHVHPRNRGYGGNQKTCYAEALREGADIVVLLHPDYQYDPKAVPLLIAPILAGDADMTFGSRFAGLGDPRAGGMPMYRYIGNRLTTIVENLFLGSRFTETHSGMRAYTRECLLSLPFLRYSDDFTFDSQFLVDAVTSGLSVIEVPIPTRYTEESSSIAIGRSLKYVAQSLLYCAGRVWERGRRGRRNPAAQAGAWGRLRQLPTARKVGSSSEEWALARAREYAVRGDRTVTLHGGPVQEGIRADVVLSLEGDGLLVAYQARRALDDEGIFGVVVPAIAASSTGRDLVGADLRIVECLRTNPHDRGGNVLILARPGRTEQSRPR